MNLTNFLGWEHDNGIYRSEVNGQFYRVVDDKLEIYDPNLLEWGECNMPINEYSKLESVEEVGFWSEGFKVHNKEEWELVKAYYLHKGYKTWDGVMFRANMHLEDNVPFYAFLDYGKVEVTTNKEIVKRDLILKSVDWEPKYYAMYFGKAKFGFQMYWQIEPNRNRVSLIEKGKVENWHSADILNTAREWQRFGVTIEDAVFIPVSSDKVTKKC